MPKTIKISILCLITLTLLVTAFDMQISQRLFNPDSNYGLWFRGFAYVPTYFIVHISLFIVSRYLLILFKKWRFAIVLLTLSGIIILNGLLVFKMYDYIQYPHITMSIIFTTFIVVSFWVAKSIKMEWLYSFAKLSSVSLLSFGVTFMSVSILKMVWGRPRFHGIVSTDALYNPWFMPSGPTTQDIMQAFPSGHTAFAALTLLLILIPLEFNTLKKWFHPLYFGLVVWILSVAVSRIVLGAHFATDTTISFIMVLVIMHYSKNTAFYIMDKYFSPE